MQMRQNRSNQFRSRNGKSRFGGQSQSNQNFKFRSNSNNNGQRRQPFNTRKRRGEDIDISKFVKKIAPEKEQKIDEITNTFADFGLCPELEVNLKYKKYATPTPIQDKAIKPIMEGKDIIGLANTGTGKTAAFLLPLINKVFKNPEEKVLIIVPTRELALQIEAEFRQFAWSMKLFSAVCVGGMPIFKQIGNLKRNPNFVIATPGRLKDLSERNMVKLPTFQNIVLDEVDRMLDMGFVDDIAAILNQLPEKRQSLFFSATMPTKIKNLVSKFSDNPIMIQVQTVNNGANVEQNVVKVRDRAMKFTQLKELLSEPEVKKVLIFSETKMDVDRLTMNLNHDGFKAESIHGNKKQNQRQRSLTLFRNDQVNILVATDVAARGLDINDISHVINYTVPQTFDDYIHRIGRTGRGDKKGTALTFVEAR